MHRRPIKSKRFAHLVECGEDLRLVVAHLLKQRGVVPDEGLRVWMLVAGRDGEPE
jgi:hypothetical protein